VHARSLPLLAALSCLGLALLTGAVLGAAPPANRITIKAFMFAPVSLTIKAGATVTWVNEDEEPHTVVSATGLFRSQAIDTKESFAFKFDKPGEYHFICTIHPQMMGTVIVQ
jgi:plastocyanin